MLKIDFQFIIYFMIWILLEKIKWKLRMGDYRWRKIWIFTLLKCASYALLNKKNWITWLFSRKKVSINRLVDIIPLLPICFWLIIIIFMSIIYLPVYVLKGQIAANKFSKGFLFLKMLLNLMQILKWAYKSNLFSHNTL